MKIIVEGAYKERISISDLKEEECYILRRSLAAAASDLSRTGIEYDNFYGTDKGTVVSLFNQFENEYEKLGRIS